ncbi:MAG: histidine kinase [Herbinix sp.]|jgi:signal transduction histidine kinase|nr:histidine kinase [Herbinix sp.]
MKKKFLFKSIYAKFALIFLAIWWFLNALTFGVVMRIMSNSGFHGLDIYSTEIRTEFFKIRSATQHTFFFSAMVGTIIILLVVRGVVKPIKRISEASKEVANGNFEVEVEVKSADEIGRLTSDFNLMVKELKNIDFLRKDFVSNVSHEFKTPITSIKGFAKLIRDGQFKEEQLFEYSDIIVRESERLSLLSSNLLKLSELDSKMIREHATTFLLDEQLRNTVLILEPFWSKKEIDFDINLEKISITADEHLLQEVWLNLIQNAIKFSLQQGTIKINLYQNEDKQAARVEITDYGLGIADEDKDRIFERFYKGDKSRSKEGNGLGLVIVKKIVELSNGIVYFESEHGKGSTFTVELPLNNEIGR